MKKGLFILLLWIFVQGSVSAQGYTTSGGVRVGPLSGLTIKHFIGTDKALEGLLSWRWNGFLVTGLYEYQKPIKEVKNLEWILGVGGHIGVLEDRRYWGYKYSYPYESRAILGVDFILGLEYIFDEVPFTLGVDWKPAVNIIGYPFWGDHVGMSIRYVFK